MAAAKVGDPGFVKDLITHSLKKDIPIIAYLVYLWFGVIKLGAGYVLNVYGNGILSVVVILTIIIVPGLVVGMRVWRS